MYFVRKKIHSKTFFEKQYYRFAIDLFCCPVTDHVMVFSRELFFYPSKNYLFIFTQLFENLKGKRSSDKYYFCMQFVMHVLFD